MNKTYGTVRRITGLTDAQIEAVRFAAGTSRGTVIAWDKTRQVLLRKGLIAASGVADEFRLTLDGWKISDQIEQTLES